MLPKPLSTYRLQFRPSFGFDQAAEIADYLSQLGISHLYASPYLQAVSGSTHGYDVVDPTCLNADLGGSEAHDRLCSKLQSCALGHIVDLVPNHMAIAGQQNPWWWDVLKNGPSSRYATYFDIDWESSEERWPNKILLPVLQDHYGRVLEKGLLQLTHNAGTFILHCHEHLFPIDASSLVDLLVGASKACGCEQLLFLAESHAYLPKATVTDRQAVEKRHRNEAVLKDLLARLCRERPEVSTAIDAQVSHLNENADALDALIERQNYRLARWHAASRDLGYRRFFDVKDLVGLRVENSEVFAACHALPLAWVKEGRVQGLRIDHPDGLRDPTAYFQSLRQTFPHLWIAA